MCDLSVVILSYNTCDITISCITALYKELAKADITSEVIVIDNASTDGSIEALRQLKQKKFETLQIVENHENVGFPRGNNQGVKLAKGTYVLLLNSDAIVEHVDFSSLIQYLNSHPDVGVLTVRLTLPQGIIDPASHRGFPTLWNAFCYFLKLEKLFGHLPVINRIVGGYHLTYLDLNTIHEIDTPSGAFYLCRKDLFEAVGGFDEDYFMYGEDIDLSYKIKQSGKKVLYYPEGIVKHLKYSSGLKNSAAKRKTKEYFYDAMKIFYRKHYAIQHTPLTNMIVYMFIDLRKKIA